MSAMLGSNELSYRLGHAAATVRLSRRQVVQMQIPLTGLLVEMSCGLLVAI